MISIRNDSFTYLLYSFFIKFIIRIFSEQSKKGPFAAHLMSIFDQIVKEKDDRSVVGTLRQKTRISLHVTLTPDMATEKKFAAKNEPPEILTGRVLTEYDPSSNTKPQLSNYNITSQKYPKKYDDV